MSDDLEKNVATRSPSNVVVVESSRIGCFEKRRRKRQMKKFYDSQAELVEEFEHDDKLLLGTEQTDGENRRRMDRILNAAAIGLNLFILCANLTACILSGSLAIVGTFVESFMDSATAFIMGLCMYLVKNANKQKYPRGRENLEMLGIIVCATIMGITNLVVILQSIDAIVEDNMHADMTLVTLIILVTGCSLKCILMVICFKRNTPPTRILALDMRNDILTSLVAIVCAFVGDRFWKYADPIGAICVCGYVAISWFAAAIEHVPHMTGKRAEQEQIARILRIASAHDERITKIDHVMLYHAGEKCIVELHIVMDEELPLKITHDIGGPLEKKLNQLDFVARSFVHCDYRCDGEG